MVDERTEQAIAQCRAVSHLATALAEVAVARGDALVRGSSLTEQIGRSTAYQMEALGDMLNGMDAITSEDEWTEPIFAKAHQMWPQKASP